MTFDRTGLAIQLLLIAAALALLFAAGRHGRGGPDRPGSPEGPGARSRLRALADVMLIAIWFGLTTGVLQLLFVYVSRYSRGMMSFTSPHGLWMTPLAYVTIFVALGAVVAAGVLLRPRLASIRLISAGYAWLGTFALLLPFVQLHRVTAAILGAGVTVQVARALGRDCPGWLARMRTSSLVLAGAIGALSIGLHVRGVVGERAALQGLPAPRAGAPNVLLLILDTVRAANLSLYGYDRQTTPELERWATQATTFDFAFSTAPWTLKSHATMFTGLYPSELGGDWVRPIRTPAPMLAELFRDRGYLTGGFVANLIYTSRETGLARGFVHYDDHHPTRRQVLLHSWIAHTPLFKAIVASRSPGDLVRALLHPDTRFYAQSFNLQTYDRRPADEITASFLKWQEGAGGRPFFAFLNFFDAHLPYQAPAPFADRFELESEENQPSMGKYDGAIAYTDQQIGRLFEELQRRGVLDRTIVVVASDHGEQFGEHGVIDHGNSLYIQALHVPLLIRYPARVPSRRRVTVPVTLRDLPATILDLAGVAGETRVPGTSLAINWADNGTTLLGSPIIAELGRRINPQPEEPAWFGPMRAVVGRRFHYIRRGDGAENLFDFRTDVAETRDLVGTRVGEQALPRLRKLLLGQAAPHVDGRPSTAPPVPAHTAARFRPSGLGAGLRRVAVGRGSSPARRVPLHPFMDQAATTSGAAMPMPLWTLLGDVAHH